MRRTITFLLLCMGLASSTARTAPPQEVIDRIVALVEGDIITLSEMRELGRFQKLVEGSAASDSRLLTQLIEQWIVNSEATAAGFPRPAESEVNRALESLEKQVATSGGFRDRLGELGLSATALRRLVEQQLYLARYLDYKFRPVAQVDRHAIETYYREQFVPPLVARGQAAPPLETMQDQIRELLIQREITERAARWLEEAKSRLKIETRGGGA